MYIQNKLVSAFYKLSLGLISLYGFWTTLALFGATAWRLFSTWALFIGAIYYCLSALILALSSKRHAGDTPAAMFEGMLIVAFIIQGISAAACTINDEYLPGLSGFAAIISYYVLPVLALLDWCLFNKKGQWRAADPFYWLALPLAYSAMIILTANMLPSSSALLYPVAFLDYNTHGLWEMLTWLALLGLLILVFGYILILLDAFMGGIIAKHIVLPHIRTVAVDDEEVSEEPVAEENEITEEIETAEEVEAIEPDEIIAAESKTSRPKAQSSNKPQFRSAKTAPNKSANANQASKPQNSSKSPKNTKHPNTQNASAKNSATKTKPTGKRKINDITKPKTDKSAGAVHKKP